LKSHLIFVLFVFQVRNINLNDFSESLKRIRRSVQQDTLDKYTQWNSEYGDMTVWWQHQCWWWWWWNLPKTSQSEIMENKLGKTEHVVNYAI